MLWPPANVVNEAENNTARQNRDGIFYCVCKTTKGLFRAKRKNRVQHHFNSNCIYFKLRDTQVGQSLKWRDIYCSCRFDKYTTGSAGRRDEKIFVWTALIDCTLQQIYVVICSLYCFIRYVEGEATSTCTNSGCAVGPAWVTLISTPS